MPQIIGGIIAVLIMWGIGKLAWRFRNAVYALAGICWIALIIFVLAATLPEMDVYREPLGSVIAKCFLMAIMMVFGGWASIRVAARVFVMGRRFEDYARQDYFHSEDAEPEHREPSPRYFSSHS